MSTLENLTPNKRLKKKKKFDPESDGYDYQTAIKAGMEPKTADAHWASRSPKTGQLLKGKKHKTWHLLKKGETKAGYEITKAKDGKYYSRKK